VQGDEQVLELLNEVFTGEHTAVNQYFLDAKMFDNWGYSHLGERFRSESIDEMKDAERLIERILYFDGHPNVQRLGTIGIGDGSRDLLEDILEGEESHADWLETQPALITQIGEAHYLAQQIRG
jgi:bacterioferritin